MLHIEEHDVKKRMLEGNFGLEKESLRIKKDGTLSHSPHPFADDTHIVKDFCENQTEINTSASVWDAWVLEMQGKGSIRGLWMRSIQGRSSRGELSLA